MHGFEAFRLARNKDLQSIAKATRGEMEADELLSEAFFLAMEIEEKTHHSLNLNSASDQELLLRWLNAKFVRFADKTMRHSIKLDEGWNDDGEDWSQGAKLANALAAPATCDPLNHQVMVEDDQQQTSAVEASYTEAAAYAILLIDRSWDFKRLADDLHLGRTRTLRNRVARAADKTLWQSSLFDGIERIDPQFVPTRSRGTKRALTALSNWIAQWRTALMPRFEAIQPPKGSTAPGSQRAGRSQRAEPRPIPGRPQ